jgi:hypothetical protein
VSARAFVTVVLALLAACGTREPPRVFEVGAHRGELRVPAGWQVLDQGGQWRLRRETSELVLRDLGPAGKEGIRNELERARALWQEGRVKEVSAHLVSPPRELFTAETDRRAYLKAWSELVYHASYVQPYARSEPAWRDVFELVDKLSPSDLAALSDAALAELGHDQRRDVKSRRALRVAQCEALDIETWNRLSHASPQRILLVMNGGYLLALYTAQHADADALAAFDSVRDTLTLAPFQAARR